MAQMFHSTIMIPDRYLVPSPRGEQGFVEVLLLHPYRADFMPPSDMRNASEPPQFGYVMFPSSSHYDHIPTFTDAALENEPRIDYDPPIETEFADWYERINYKPPMDMEFGDMSQGGGISIVRSSDNEAVDCAICMKEMCAGDGNETITKLPCDHLFHRDCIMFWRCNNSTCPLCRSKLPEELDST